MRGFFRVLSWVMFLIAVLAIVTDVTRSMAAHAVVMVPLLEHWSKLWPTSLASFQGFVGKVPFLWTVAVKPALSIPAWLIFGWLGMMFAYFGRRRRKINVYAN